MKKKYIQPSAEFEEIEGLNDLMDGDKSVWNTDGSGTTSDNTPTDLPWGGDTPGTDPGVVDDPNDPNG